VAKAGREKLALRNSGSMESLLAAFVRPRFAFPGPRVGEGGGSNWEGSSEAVT